MRAFTLGLALSLLGVLAPSVAYAQSYNATANCGATPTGHVDWPAANPVWSFDYVRPANSSGADASGLELTNVYYRGRLVLRQAHVPVLNVEYDAGVSCGCYRDWSYEEAGFATDGIRSGTESCLADATPGAVQTTCDTNMSGGAGGDPGSFRGVAIEDYGDELVLTANLTAGWYRYRMKWHFYTDGRIWPEYSFSAASAVCTQAGHRHHAYWRLDFDYEDSGATQIVREINPTDVTSTVISTETMRTWGDPADGIYWEIRSSDDDAGYDLIPSSADLELGIDPFSKFDALIARYNPGEIDDGSAACAINPNAFLNNENVEDEDVVFWYRSSALHTAGNPWECDIVGPTLMPTGLVTAAEPPPSAEMPEGYELERARPNPFNPTTTIRFRVADAQPVRVALVDALGREVAVLFDGYAEAGRYETARVDGTALPSGTYTVVLDGETVRGTTRVVLVK